MFARTLFHVGDSQRALSITAVVQHPSRLESVALDGAAVWPCPLSQFRKRTYNGPISPTEHARRAFY